MEESSDAEESSKEAKERMKRTRTYSKYILPSNRTPFSTHFDVLRRFVTVTRSGSEGVEAHKVEGEGVPVQAAQMNVRFMRSIGLLSPTERGKYAPTQDAIRFVNARSVSDEKARPILSGLILSSWFAETARSLLSAQPLMTEDQFLGELALAAETDKSREEPALRVILEYLVYTGIVNRDERGLSLGSGSSGQTVGGTVGIEPLQETRPFGEKTAAEGPGWHILQTEDFYVKVKSDMGVVEDLELFLQTLKKKIARLHPSTTSADNSAHGSEDRVNIGMVGGLRE